MRALLFHKTFIAVFVEYFNYSNSFLVENITENLEYTKLNNYAITLKENKQSSFEPIYNLEPVELKTLKMYIKNNFTNSFIQLFKFLSGTFIFFY